MISTDNKTNVLYRILLLMGVLFLTLGGITFILGNKIWPGPLGILGFASLGLFLQSTSHFKGLSFTLWVLSSITACLSYPELFTKWGDFELKKLIVPLIQLIMFGMGTTLSITDFTRVFQMPRAFLIGMFLQFGIMPLVGFLLAKTFGLQGMIAVGLILIGSCPGGVASNVITYLARGNVALSVTMTACSTLASPLMTPLMMKLLANQYTYIDFWAMMLNIFQMIIFPIVAGLIVNKLLYKFAALRDRILPVLSMVCICLIIAIITAISRDSLLTMGVVIFSVAVLHNAIGYVLGYSGARLLGLDKASCRTIAIEVGLQNGGMASGIAMNVLNSAEAGLAPAIFGPWQNVSGSILASIWRRKPVDASNTDIKDA